MNERSLFLAALEISDPAARAAYLYKECGNDAALRQRVEKLLKAHDEAGSFLEKPAAADSATGAYTPEADLNVAAMGSQTPTSPSPLFPEGRRVGDDGPGARIGPYKLLQQIGEGGMGTVYMAEQTEPVRRMVALKIIKAGMDSKEVVARFDAERQALAVMDHQNIAKVFDAGTTSTGRLYFVMELVKGVPITKYCDDNRLTPRQRLELFMPVCHALQHAHQKGIIHRDIKPSNVLVAPYDGRPVVKVIDFGIAKATGQRLTERTMFTEFGAVIGTLEYMSPEQAELNNQDIDTRSDIYSLGVLLYELLTGTTPLNRTHLKLVAFTEMLRIIREEEPPRPSNRLSSSKEALPTISAQRQTEPAKLSKLMRGDLDWIVMKSLDKDRARRYETANGLARDIERYLNDDAVEACPPSAGYRLKKFLRRNKGPAMAAALVLGAVTLGAVISAWQAWRATLAEETALQAEAKAKVESEVAQQQSERAQKAREEAVAAAKEMNKQLTRAEWLLYASKIALAQRELEAENVNAASAVLKSSRPDFRSWEYGFLLAQFDSDKIVCKAPSIDAISRDGKLLASSDYRLGRWGVTVWDVETGKLVLSLKHSGPVRALAFNGDGTRLACGGAVANEHEKPADLKVWDLETGKLIFNLEGHVPGVVGVCYSPDGKKIASLAGNLFGKNSELKVWDALTGAEVLSLQGPGGGYTGSVGGLAYSPDGKRIAAGMAQLLKVWDSETGKEVLSFKAHQYVVTSLAYAPDGKRIATTSNESAMKLWETATGKEVLGIQNGGAVGIAFSPDGKRIASPKDQLVVVWDAVTGKEIRSFKTGTSSGLAFNLDGKRLAIAAGTTVKMWEIDKGQGGFTFKAGKSGLSSMALSPDGKRIATASALLDSTVKVWDTQNGKLVFNLKGHKDFASSVAFSRDGKTLASASRDGTTRIWEMKDGTSNLTLNSKFRQAGVVALSPDGNLLATNEDDKTVSIWDLQSRKPTFTLLAATDSVLSLAFSPDGKHLASGNSGMRDNVKVWNVQTGEVTFTQKGPNVFSVAFSPDGHYLASAGIDETIKVWNLKTGDEFVVLRGHTGSVESVTFSPDGKRVATASADGTIKLWETQQGFETITLSASREPLRALAFSSDGQQLACAGLLGTVRIWDAGLK